MNISKAVKFMRIAESVASFSKDPSTKVGCVIIDDDYNILATGWNGFPRGVTDSEERLWNRETKYQLTTHAEANAICASARTGRKLAGATLIVSSLYPCNVCAGLIAQAGLKRVIAPRINNNRWKESNEMARLIFTEAAVEVIEIDSDLY
jgi:dCMP deaminase